jgi:hypothetical protein
MYDFVAVILIPLNFFYFSYCFFQKSTDEKRSNAVKISMTFSVVPVCLSFFFKSFETLQTATPLQLLVFISSILVFVTAGKVLVQYPWKAKLKEKEIQQVA